MSEGQKARATTGAVATSVMQLLSRSILARVTGFLASVVLARLLAPEDFGRAAVAMSIVNIAVFFLDSGLSAAALRSAEEPSLALLRALSGIQLGLTALAVLVIAPIALAGDHAALTLVALVLLPVLSLHTPLLVVAERRLDFRQISNAELASNLGSQGLTVILALIGTGVWALVVGAVVRPVLSGLWMSIGADKRLLLPSLRIKPALPLLRDGLQLQVIPASMMMREQGTILIAASSMGASPLGIYILVGRLLAVPVAVFGALGRVAYPAMAARRREGGIEHAQVLRAMRRVALVASWSLGMTCALSIYAVPIIFGDLWVTAVPALLITSPGILVITAISVPTSSLLVVERRITGPTLAVLSHAAVAWCVLVLAPLGSTAATIALSATLGSVTEGLVLLAYMKRRGMPWLHSVLSVAPALVFGALAVAAGWSIGLLVGSTLASLVTPAAAAAVMLLCTWLFFQEEWTAARDVLARQVRSRRADR